MECRGQLSKTGRVAMLTGARGFNVLPGNPPLFRIPRGRASPDFQAVHEHQRPSPFSRPPISVISPKDDDPGSDCSEQDTMLPFQGLS